MLSLTMFNCPHSGIEILLVVIGSHPLSPNEPEPVRSTYMTTTLRHELEVLVGYSEDLAIENLRQTMVKYLQTKRMK